MTQYYLGANGRISLQAPPAYRGAGRLDGAGAKLADAAGNPLDAAGGEYPGVRTPFQPYEGDWFAAAKHQDNSWMRLSRTVDLTGTDASAKPSLQLMLSYDTESDYDNVVVEAHTVGQDDWTTLPDANGGTATGVPADCSEGFYVRGHPFLEHYLTVGDDDCQAKGSTGSWNRFTGSSDGWQPVDIDLTGYAGKRVELAISYITDPGTGGRGVFVDNTKLVVGGTDQSSEGFETALGPWTVPGPPPGSPTSDADWVRSKELFRSSAAVTTDDTVLLGFGLEHISSAVERAELLGAALQALHR